MNVLFIAGFGPIASDVNESRSLYEDALGIAFKVEEGDYLHTEQVDGAKTLPCGRCHRPLSRASAQAAGPQMSVRPRPGSSSTSKISMLGRASSKSAAIGFWSASARSHGDRSLRG
jgi:hypothetical protein